MLNKSSGIELNVLN
jgi:DnaJ-domain-containing protein 1